MVRGFGSCESGFARFAFGGAVFESANGRGSVCSPPRNRRREGAASTLSRIPERGGADNVVGVNFATREFLFDHFLPADGPSMQDIRTRLQNALRVRSIKRDLGIFGDQ